MNSESLKHNRKKTSRALSLGLMLIFLLSAVFSLHAQQLTGNAELVQTIDFNGAGGAPGMRFGDVDGDGRLDIVVGQPLPQSQFDGRTGDVIRAIPIFPRDDRRGAPPVPMTA